MVVRRLIARRFPEIVSISELKLIIPSPPICIRRRMTTWPALLKPAVLTVPKPATHTADEAVNTASVRLIVAPPPTHIPGMRSRTVPAKITTIKNARR
jgi:hypothetical protein